MVMNKLAEEFIRDYCLYLRNEVGLTQSSVWIYSIPLKQAYYNEQHHKMSEFTDFIKRNLKANADNKFSVW